MNILEKTVLQTLSKRVYKTVLIACSFLLTSQIFASEGPNLEQIKKQVEKTIPDMEIDLISESPLPGIYEILTSGQLLYVSADAKFLISGRLFSLENGITDLTAQSIAQVDMKKAPMRRDKVNAVDKSEMIIFKAADEKHVITVFTDVDCAYCRKLHKEMPKYNELGITVQYMGFPRAGLGSPSYQKLRAVWCAKDPNAAMDRAKLDRTFGNDTCDDPLPKQFKLVREFGLTGTPAIILKSGRLHSGYADAKTLLELVTADEALLTNSEATAE